MKLSNDTALLIIDMQNEYFEGGKMPLSGINEAASNAEELLKFFRENGLHVLHVQHFSNKKESPVFVPGSKEVEINKSVTPVESETVIKKNFPNSFRETSLHEELESRHIKNLVICGAMSHMCIDTTVRAANDLGYMNTVIGDACATRDLSFNNEVIPAIDVHNSFMAAFQWGFAQVKRTAEFIDEANR